MAYIKDIERQCMYGGHCLKRATKEVFNRRNASHGYFCTAHAKMYLATLRKDEEFERAVTVLER